MADIGEGQSALYCMTDNVECCKAVHNRLGEFYYPNGVQVPIFRMLHGLYRNRGEQLIRLNKRKGTVPPKGKYRCDIPDAIGNMKSIYITVTA